jgi:hypothetical protein
MQTLHRQKAFVAHARGVGVSSVGASGKQWSKPRRETGAQPRASPTGSGSVALPQDAPHHHRRERSVPRISSCPRRSCGMAEPAPVASLLVRAADSW